jgi:Putative Actinobacterial Holin-X, holin superfamily III
VRGHRSLVDVFDDIFGNLQEIVRSEIHLARAEVSEELRSAKSSALGMGFAMLAGAFALLFALLSGMYALTRVMAGWQAALIIAAALATVSAIALVFARLRARKRQRPVSSPGTGTAASIEEDLKWIRPSIR